MWRSIVLTALVLYAGSNQAAVVPFALEGVGGAGLLPTNEIGSGAETSGSTASGGAIGGFSFDTDTGVLSLDFGWGEDAAIGMTHGFGDLSGALRQSAAGGVHIHGPASVTENASVVFALSNGSQPSVTTTLSADLLAGRVMGTLVLDGGQAADLMAGSYYINIHSESFAAGELRANLAPVPLPAGVVLFASALGLLAGSARRRA